MNYTSTRQTQDWQLEAYEMQSKHNRFIRHQRTINEMDCHPTQWGVNMSERKK
jgi:hypothetical protein